MNVDILRDNPTWRWYPLVGGCLLLFTVTVWVSTKFTNVGVRFFVMEIIVETYRELAGCMGFEEDASSITEVSSYTIALGMAIHIYWWSKKLRSEMQTIDHFKDRKDPKKDNSLILGKLRRNTIDPLTTPQ